MILLMLVNDDHLSLITVYKSYHYLLLGWLDNCQENKINRLTFFGTHIVEGWL